MSKTLGRPGSGSARQTKLAAQAAMVRVLYDGQCPICSSYIGSVQIEPAYPAEILDAREHSDLTSEYARRGIDINRGMVVRFDGVDYIGSDALVLLASISARHTWIQRIYIQLSGSRRAARFFYPVFRLLRTLLLRAMNRSMIPTDQR